MIFSVNPQNFVAPDLGNPLEELNRSQAAKAEAANLLAKTRLSAPIRVGLVPSVEGRIRADGNPRRTLCSMVCFSAASTNDQARTISPPTTTASGLKPTTRFEIPTPRHSAISIKAVVAWASPESA